MTGAEMILVERKRQIEKEGWDAKHDHEEHRDGQLVDAAICYAVNRSPSHEGKVHVVVPAVSDSRDLGITESKDPRWPWAKHYDKRSKHDRIKSLTIAGALIAAEIDRIAGRAQVS